MNKTALYITSLAISLALMACSAAESQVETESAPTEATAEPTSQMNESEVMADDTMANDAMQEGGMKTAVLAGGCFWCVEADFEKLDGVSEVVSGYTGGTTANPTYEEVTYNNTGHYEAAEIYYDPSVVSYDDLLDYYWKTIDPTDANGQFCDQGDSYRTAIFATPEQEAAAEASLADIKQTKPFDAPIVTPVKELGEFYKAEDYHQDYYKKSSLKYKFYRTRCGRDGRLEDLWGEVVTD
ncbi:peptide-methionine (S)-S-oxide reductase MsrA [Litorimonas haliclonae]|uniref:peptide-methionine (S)-S-oxide reductase MsrA n=1 Tax=Litorimonas haliclonae TaxID=2081977 RepID=UPI0039EFE085